MSGQFEWPRPNDLWNQGRIATVFLLLLLLLLSACDGADRTASTWPVGYTGYRCPQGSAPVAKRVDDKDFFVCLPNPDVCKMYPAPDSK